MAAETSSSNAGENSRARLELLLDAEKLSRLLLDQLKHGAENRLYGIGDERLVASVILRCLAFRRSLLENKPGPKMSVEKQLQEMEEQVYKILGKQRGTVG